MESPSDACIHISVYLYILDDSDEVIKLVMRNSSKSEKTKKAEDDAQRRKHKIKITIDRNEVDFTTKCTTFVHIFLFCSLFAICWENCPVFFFHAFLWLALVLSCVLCWLKIMVVAIQN